MYRDFGVNLVNLTKPTKDYRIQDFLVVDSPLLAYWAPEGDEDHLTGTDLKERFYEYLLGLQSDTQVIVVENQHPPDFVFERANVITFTKNSVRAGMAFLRDNVCTLSGRSAGGRSSRQAIEALAALAVKGARETTCTWV